MEVLPPTECEEYFSETSMTCGAEEGYNPKTEHNNFTSIEFCEVNICVVLYKSYYVITGACWLLKPNWFPDAS